MWKSHCCVLIKSSTSNVRVHFAAELPAESVGQHLATAGGNAKRFGLSFNEETATEVLLLDIAEQFPGKVTIIPFSHSREARIGADWAWGFVGPDGHSFQGMLVQAKRLDDKDSEYQGLSYPDGQKGSGQSQSQIDRLIESGKRYGLPPIYAFYNHLSNTTHVPADSCESLGMIPQLMPESWGVTIASAYCGT